jgi:N-acetylmuramoyl-L-alanine amidase
MGRWGSRSQLWYLSLALPVLMLLFATAATFGRPAATPTPGTAQGTPAAVVVVSPQTFPTGYVVEGVFLDYWARYGGLMRFGFPLSAAVRDPASDGLIVQYFERARFEYQADNQPPYNVLLTLLGSAALGARPERGASPAPCSSACELFPPTGHTLRGVFRRYWLAGGGLPVFGYPLTEEFTEVSPTDGKPYVVQYFERARFEHHPEYAGTDYEVLLGHLGRESLAARPDIAGLPAVTVPDAPSRAKVIVLDPGHDRTTGGALGTEYRDTLRTALALKPLLEARGYTVYLTRPDNETVLVNDPALLPANPAGFDPGYLEGYAHATRILALQPDLAISIHYNGSTSPAAAGSTTYYSEQGGAQNRRLATLVQNEIAAALRDRGYTPPYSRIDLDTTIGKTYGGLATLGAVASTPGSQTSVNRLIGLPIVLTEALFETNATERALIADDATIARLAEGYARAIDAYFASAE